MSCAGAVATIDQLPQLAETLATPNPRADELGGPAARPEQIAPMSNRAVLTRLLMNQATRAEQGGQPGRALVVMERITTVAPAYSPGWWERARLERAQGDFAAARASLSSMLETTRDPELRGHVTSALATLAG